MGWTYAHRCIGLTHKEFFAGVFDGEKGRLLDAAGVGYDQVYVAYALLDPTGAITDVIGVAIHTKWIRSQNCENYGYKAFEESEGPYIHRCPERILDLLTPTTDEGALKWRAACRQQIHSQRERARFQLHDLVLFPHDLHFSNGDRLRLLRVVSPGRRLRFDAPLPLGRSLLGQYRVRRHDLGGTVVLASTNPRARGASRQLRDLLEAYGADAVGDAYQQILNDNGYYFPLSDALSDPEKAEDAVAALLMRVIDAQGQPASPGHPGQQLRLRL